MNNKFTDREKGFEKKFVKDEELQFKVQARSNKYIAEFVCSKLGKLEGWDAQEFIKGTPKTDRRHDPEPDLPWRRAAGVAEPAGRTGLDPRHTDDPGGHFRGLRPHPQRGDDYRTRPRPAGAPDQRHEHQRTKIHSADHPVAAMGAGVRRVARRHRRRQATFHAALEAAGIH